MLTESQKMLVLQVIQAHKEVIEPTDSREQQEEKSVEVGCGVSEECPTEAKSEQELCDIYKRMKMTSRRKF